MITFLRDNFDPDYQLQQSGTLLTIKEDDPAAKLKEVRIILNDYENSFAFVMDRRKKRHCDNKKCDQRRRDECNNLHSKVCNFFKSNKGLHKGCDAIIVTCEGNNVFFTICELKSENLADAPAKFKMAKALVSYLCEVATMQNYNFLLQFVAFNIDEYSSHHHSTGRRLQEPGKKREMINNIDNFSYSLLSFSAHEAENKPQVTLKRIQEGGATEEKSGPFYACSWSCSRTKSSTIPISS